MATLPEASAASLSNAEMPPLSPFGLEVRVLTGGGICLGYAVQKGAAVAADQAGFVHNADVRVVWELHDGEVLRWERWDEGEGRYRLQVFRGVEGLGSFEDGKLSEAYRCYTVPASGREDSFTWAMDVLKGSHEGQTVYPYAGAPIRPLQIAVEAGQREVLVYDAERGRVGGARRVTLKGEAVA